MRQPMQTIKRLRLAWAFKVWPWHVPAEAVKFLQWPVRITKTDRQRTEELAQRYNWERDKS